MNNIPLDSIIWFFSGIFYAAALLLCFAEWAFIDKFKLEQLKLIVSDLFNMLVEIVFISSLGIVFFTEEVFTSRLFEIPASWFTFLFAIVLYDLFFYAEHLLMHRADLMWSIHHIHHSSERYGLSLGFRISWFRPLRRLFFYYPMLFVGFDAKLIWASMLVINGYGFYVHSRFKFKYPKYLTYLISPHIHSIHHEVENTHGVNLGGLFSIWDRIFKTYKTQSSESPQYGIPNVKFSLNPFSNQLNPVGSYLRKSFFQNKVK